MSRNCLNEEILTSYLEDSLEASVRVAAEEHLVSCDGCRSRLVYYMRVLDDEVREEEEPVLEAAMRDWNADTIPVPVRGAAARGRMNPAVFAIAAIAASVVVGVLVGVFAGLEDPPVLGDEASLEAILRDRRGFQARTSLQESSEDYVEFVATRDATRAPGTGVSGLDSSMAPEDPDGIGSHYLGLYYLAAELDFDRAVAYLTRALEESGEDPRVLNDLGVAYFIRPKGGVEAEATDQNVARRLFDDALKLDPDFLPARFNQVLLNSEAGMVAEMRVQAENYLEADPDSGWAREVVSLVGTPDGEGDD